MSNVLSKIKNQLFLNPQENHMQDFQLELCHKNNHRFAILPLFNILTQICCYAIYLYVYPAVYPDKNSLNKPIFTAFTIFYIVTNIVFCILFLKTLKRKDEKNYYHNSNLLIMLFLVFYITVESIETIVEVDISGNIYRFLATFFVVAFLPILTRLKKFLLLFAFAFMVELGLYHLIATGLPDNNYYREITAAFFVVCLIVSYITYNGTVRTFTLTQNLIEANEKLQYLTVIDPLTTLYNRRAFNDSIKSTWKECAQNGGTISVMMVDIDHFKSYNDNYGHQIGDDILVAIAKEIKSCFRQSVDMVARYGGEEFIILLPYTELSDSITMAERLRTSIEALEIAHTNNKLLPVVTISIGVAAATPRPDGNYEHLIKQADDALFKAKREGRNRVCSA
jgi:diguanylate cyclase (GGDEF)-like protein